MKTISTDPRIAALEAALEESRRQVEALTELVAARARGLGGELWVDVVAGRSTPTQTPPQTSIDELARTRLREANEAREWLLARINPQMTPGTYFSTETLPELLKRYGGLVDLNAAEAREARQWLAMQLDRAGLEHATLLEMIKRYDQKEHDRARKRAGKLRAQLRIARGENDNDNSPSYRTASEARLEQLNRQGVAFGEQLAELREENAALKKKLETNNATIDRLRAEIQETNNATIDKLRAELTAWDGAEVLEMCNELSGVVTLVGRLNVAVAYDPRYESEASARARLQETISNVCRNVASDVKVGGTPTQAQILKFYGQAASDEHVDHPPHYNAHPSGIEAIDLCERLGFTRGNAIKYLWRAGKKGPALKDIKKALWYMKRGGEDVSGAALDLMRKVHDAEPDSILGRVLRCSLDAARGSWTKGVIPTLKEEIQKLESGK